MNPDFRDLLAAFNARGVDFLIVGAHALAAHGLVHATVEPIRIGVITAIDGVEFPEAWAQRISARFADQEVAVLSREHLLTNKRADGREQDLLDVKWLERTSQEKP